MLKDTYNSSYQLHLLVKQHIEHFIQCTEQVEKVKTMKSYENIFNKNKLKCLEVTLYTKVVY